MRTTVGQILVNSALPEDLRDYNRVIDKKTIRLLMTQVAEQYPEDYRDIAQKLNNVGRAVATYYGREASLSMKDLRREKVTEQRIRLLRQKAKQIAMDKRLTQEQKNNRIVKLMSDNMGSLNSENQKEGMKANNAFAAQVKAGVRGNETQFGQLRVGDLLAADHRETPIPIPLLKSYGEGVDPAEYWAASYGARRGYIGVKFATPKAGFLSKQLANATHRLIVTEKDCETKNGIPVNPNDMDNEGAVVSSDYGDVKRNSVLNPKTLRMLGKRKRIYVRSPLTCSARRGVCQRCAGAREHGDLPPLGTNVGISASAAISEPLTQGQISSKHIASSIGAEKSVTGFDLINQLVQIPKTFKGGAAISSVDGKVTSITNAPQGGKFITVGQQQFHAPEGLEPTVKINEKVEAGDILSKGIPNPALVVQYKGIGEGRLQLVKQLKEAFTDANIGVNRRNLEIVARGLVNHVTVNDLDGPNETLPGDTVEYDSLIRGYEPRYGTKRLTPKKAVGLFLEEPVLQYSIGTRVTPRMARTFKDNDIGMIAGHPEHPSFQPDMKRAMESLGFADDWMVRMGGFHLKKNLLKGVHRADESHAHSESYIPSLASAVDFGKSKKIGY